MKRNKTKKGWAPRILPLLMLCLLTLLQTVSYAADYLLPMGNTVGISMQTEGVMVVDVSEFEGADGGKCCPAKDAGLHCGDIITGINSHKIESSADFITAVSRLTGDAVDITLKRGEEEILVKLTPEKTADGDYRIGVWLRDGVAGIGTLTYVDPETGAFGALGHGINDIESGVLIPVGEGSITESEVTGVIKGVSGCPGELSGSFKPEEVLGSVAKNCEAGIFGTYTGEILSRPMPVGSESEVRLGEAAILANVDGSDCREYSVEINRIYHDKNDNRDFLISVTDTELLDITGGIVQGMSGSPILQDGKIIGAVTHVLINDPTRGYGISIENMLDAAG